MRYYCTYFDRNYLTRALALITSLRQHETEPFTMYAVCMDEISRTMLNKMNIPNVATVPFHEIEENDFALLATKKDRTTAEYYWTSTPTIIQRIIESNPEIDMLTYLDADLLFFSSPAALFDEMSNASVLIHEHRYSPELAALEEENGKYNVGLLTFKNTNEGMAVLRWWRERCIEWCYARYEDGKMGDQYYLNYWQDKFTGVHALENIGGGVAPWNQSQYEFTKDSVVKVNGTPVIFYHFQSFAFYNEKIAIPAKHTTYPYTKEILNYCVVPYINALNEELTKVRSVLPEFDFGFEREFNLTGEHTFIIDKDDVTKLNTNELPQRPIELDGGKVCFASRQVVTGGTAEMESDKGRPKEEITEEIYSEDQLLLKLASTNLVDDIETVCIVGAHIYQEEDLVNTMFPNLKRVYLFEPIPPFYNHLKEKYKDDVTVSVFPYAISDSNGTAEFYVTDNAGASSSLMQFKEHKRLFPHVSQTEKIPVETKTLESVIDEFNLYAPDFLFLDVQGYEFNILSSIPDSLLSKVKLIYTEASKEELYEGAKTLDDVAHVLQSKFTFKGFSPLAQNTPTHGNALFINNGAGVGGDDDATLSMDISLLIKREMEYNFELMNNNRLQELSQRILKLFSLYKTNKKVILHISELLIHLDNAQNAKMVLENALEIWTDDVDILNNLSVANILLEDYPAAEEYAEKVKAVDPANQIARENLNYINKKRSN